MPKKSTWEQNHPQCAAATREAVDAVRRKLTYQTQRAKDFETALGQTLDALKIIRQCASDRRSEVTNGECTTYEDAFRRLEIAYAALRFIEQQAAEALA